MKDKCCHKCGKIGDFVADYPDNKVNTKASHVCATDQMLNLALWPRQVALSQGQVSCVLRPKSMERMSHV